MPQQKNKGKHGGQTQETKTVNGQNGENGQASTSQSAQNNTNSENNGYMANNGYFANNYNNFNNINNNQSAQMNQHNTQQSGVNQNQYQPSDLNFYLPPMADTNVPQQVLHQQEAPSFQQFNQYQAPRYVSPPRTNIAQSYIAQGIRSQSNVNTDQQTSLIVEMINKLDTRLNSIENNISKLGQIQDEVSKVRADVYDLKAANRTLHTKFDELEVFSQSMSNVSDEFYNHKRYCSNTFNDLQAQNRQLHNKVNILQSENAEFKEKLIELQWRSMRDNLIFVGIAESEDPSSENCEKLVRNFLEEHVERDPTINPDNSIVINDLVFSRVHRLGGPKPRPIVAKFLHSKQREVIKTAGIKLNKQKKDVYINEQFPPLMEERRRQLFPIMRRMKSNPQNTVSLSRDRLFVNGLLYDIDSGLFLEPRTKKVAQRQPRAQSNEHEINQNPVRRHAEAFSDSQRQPVSQSLVNFNSVDFERSHHDRRDTPYSRTLPPSDSTDRTRPKQQSRSRQSSRPRENYETPNRFATLSRDRSVSVTRKANSPLEETALKRVHSEHENEPDNTNLSCVSAPIEPQSNCQSQTERIEVDDHEEINQ